jgi:hypothetical protein
VLDRIVSTLMDRVDVKPYWQVDIEAILDRVDVNRLSPGWM